MGDGSRRRGLLPVLWADRYEQETGYTPPLTPATKRIRIYQRPASAPASALPRRVAVDLSRIIAKFAAIDRQPDPDISPYPPAPPTDMTPNGQLRSSQLRQLEHPIVELTPGLHLVVTPGNLPDVAFEVPYPVLPAAGNTPPVAAPIDMPALRTDEVAAQPVVLRTDNPNAQITVLDASYARVSIGTGVVSLSLAPGLYKARCTSGPNRRNRCSLLRMRPRPAVARARIFRGCARHRHVNHAPKSVPSCR